MNERVKTHRDRLLPLPEWHELVDISVSGAGFLGPESLQLWLCLELSDWYLGNGRSSCYGVAGSRNGKGGPTAPRSGGTGWVRSQEIPRSAFCLRSCFTQATLVSPGQPAAWEMMLGLRYLGRSVSGPGEKETPAKTNSPAVPGAFECQQCGLTTSPISIHQSSHGGDKPYCCLQCSKSFRRGSDLG